MPRAPVVQVDDGGNIITLEHGIDGECVMGCIQNRFPNFPLRIPVTQLLVSANPRNRVVLACFKQSWINRQVVRAVGSRKHVQRTTVIILFAVTVPAPGGILVGKLTFASTPPIAGFPAITEELAERTRAGFDR